MATPSSAPAGGSGGQGPRLPGPPPVPGQYRPPPGYGPPGMPGQGMPRPPARPRLTKTQQVRVTLVSAILLVLGIALGSFATIALPQVYAARADIRYNLSDSVDGAGDADRTLATQTVIITGREVLQPVADSTGVPLDYLLENVTATVLPNSEVITIQVDHTDRASGVQLADAIVKRYLDVANNASLRAQVQAQLENAQRQLANPATPAATLPTVQRQVTELQDRMADLATRSNIATVVAPAYSVLDPVFPDPLITIGIGALAGALVAALVANRMINSMTRR